MTDQAIPRQPLTAWDQAEALRMAQLYANAWAADIRVNLGYPAPDWHDMSEAQQEAMLRVTREVIKGMRRSPK